MGIKTATQWPIFLRRKKTFAFRVVVVARRVVLLLEWQQKYIIMWKFQHNNFHGSYISFVTDGQKDRQLSLNNKVSVYALGSEKNLGTHTVLHGRSFPAINENTTKLFSENCHQNVSCSFLVIYIYLFNFFNSYFLSQLVGLSERNKNLLFWSSHSLLLKRNVFSIDKIRVCYAYFVSVLSWPHEFEIML